MPEALIYSISYGFKTDFLLLNLLTVVDRNTECDKNSRKVSASEAEVWLHLTQAWKDGCGQVLKAWARSCGLHTGDG